MVFWLVGLTGFKKRVSGALRAFINIVLDLDTTAVPTEQIHALNDLLARHRFSMNAKTLTELVSILKKKHLVDEICITQKNGSLLASTSGNGVNEAITTSAMFNYIQSELPKAEAILIKNSGWNMMFSFGGKIYLVKSPASMTTLELKAISKEIERFLDKNQKEEQLAETPRQQADNLLIK